MFAGQPSMDNNLAAVLYGPEDLRLEQRPIPEIEDDEVLLQMDCVGICGSDVHYYVNGRIGNFFIERPMVTGHEASGVVMSIGKNVTNLRSGDRVAIEPGFGCRACEPCKTGRYNLCSKMIFCATPPNDGNLMKYYKHPADFCFKLPPNVTMEEGALLEPLSVGVHVCRRAGIGLGSEVLIFGAGAIGLVVLVTAKAMGASKILMIDKVQCRLDMAKSLGATETMLVRHEMHEHQMVEHIHEALGSLPDKTIDCCGGETTSRLAILATRPGGCVTAVGMCQKEVKIPITTAIIREIDIRGAFRYSNDYRSALALISSGSVNIKKLVTHHFDITEVKKAFEFARSGHEGAIKVMVHCRPRDENNFMPFKI